jgi:hypothetical protein
MRTLDGASVSPASPAFTAAILVLSTIVDWRFKRYSGGVTYLPQVHPFLQLSLRGTKNVALQAWVSSPYRTTRADRQIRLFWHCRQFNLPGYFSIYPQRAVVSFITFTARWKVFRLQNAMNIWAEHWEWRQDAYLHIHTQRYRKRAFSTSTTLMACRQGNRVSIPSTGKECSSPLQHSDSYTTGTGVVSPCERR